MKRMWLVRAGEHGYLFDQFQQEKIVAIGWAKTGDLSSLKRLEQIKQVLQEEYPDYKEGRVNISAGQINRFVNVLKVGDGIMTYDPVERFYLLGTITSDYKYEEQVIEGMPNLRQVKWEDKLNRDDLRPGARNVLGSIMTLFEVPSHVQQELYALLGKKPIAKSPLVAAEPEEELETIKEDVIAKANEFIKDKLQSLSWSEMEELVAGVLRGMGYKTRMTSRGPDRGRDILASPDGLGLEKPRIMVQVKHRKGTTGADEIRGFIGGLRAGDTGVFVSTGGFSMEAKYEAERSNIPISILDFDILVELLTQYYESLDVDTKAFIPLRKIFWPL